MSKKNIKNNKKNLCGPQIRKLRLSMPGKPSQQQFAQMLQSEGLNIGKSAIQKIEAGTRCVYDIELRAILKVLNTTCDELFRSDN